MEPREPQINPDDVPEVDAPDHEELERYLAQVAADAGIAPEDGEND